MSNVMSRVLVYGLVLAGIGAFVATDVKMHQPAKWEDNHAIITGPNLPGGQSELGKTDVHVVYMGINETCWMETWIVPMEYENVAAYLDTHPEATADSEGPSEFSPLCDDNEYKDALPEPARTNAYYDDMTGTQRRHAYLDNFDQDKV